MSARGTRQLLFVIGCVVCLLAVASALPAADPRLTPPGAETGADSNTTVGGWESVRESTGLTPDPSADRESDSTTDDDRSGVHDPDIEIDGALEPGNEVTIRVDGRSHFSEWTVEVDGEPVGTVGSEPGSAAFGSGTVDTVVPYAEEMTVSVPDADHSRTVDIETTATISLIDGAAPGADVEVSATVGSTPVEDATVSLDDEPVATTDEDGRANVTLPAASRPVELRVERDPVAGERTVDVPEPQVAFVSPFVFPTRSAPVAVSADGTPVPNATVSLENGETATTDDDGRATLSLPRADEATVTASIGEETATATVENLYLRLAVFVVLGPGFVIGGVVTYLRVAARRDGRASGLDGLLADLSVLFAGAGTALSRVTAAGSRFASGLAGSGSILRGLRAPSAPRLSLSMPRLAGGDWQFPSPSIGSGLASVGRAFGSMPSLGSLLEPSDRDGGSQQSRTRFRDWFSGDDEEETDAVDCRRNRPPALADDPLGPRGPRAEIRAAWHAFLDRLGTSDRETLTPGQAARRALAAGFPAERVSRLVAIVRDVEYGSREPSPDRVLEARDTATDLIEHEDAADEEGSE